MNHLETFIGISFVVFMDMGVYMAVLTFRKIRGR